MKDWRSANKLYLLLQKPFSNPRSLYQLSFLSPNYFFQLLVMRIWYLHETVSPSWPFSFFLSMYWYCMEKFYYDHSLVLSQAWYMGKILSPYEESISHSKALPLNLRLYGEQGPLRILLGSAMSIPSCFVGRISKRVRNPKVWGSIPHGYSEYFLCLTLVTRRKDIVLYVFTALDSSGICAWKYFNCCRIKWVELIFSCFIIWLQLFTSESVACTLQLGKYPPPLRWVLLKKWKYAFLSFLQLTTLKNPVPDFAFCMGTQRLNWPSANGRVCNCVRID